MILAAGLTPAWQQIMCFRRLVPGAVNRAGQVHWCASGKVLNVGMALASLEVSSHTIAPLGGWSGAAIRTEFQTRGLLATWTPTGAATRVCTTVLSEEDHLSTELVENAAGLTEADLDAYAAVYHGLAKQANIVVLTGSLPTGTPPTFYRRLVENTPCPVVLDARGPELLAALSARPRVVKPNREELAATVGRTLANREDLLDAMRELIERGAQAVVVTQGKEAVWVMEGREVWELTPPVVTPIVNPIGCGDCLAAGIAWGLSRGDALLDAVRLAMAAAADNLRDLLPARLSRERVEQLGRVIG
ncbi:MAG: bifunctional hydroxymethylpyrimidine kinase/phosphomethylpyrimidine kinase [Planctomycetes bacterium]|nr:bifunctional hydroxymethylpyrimidine kinase/phosphomethylpyrimidine kinase [Planctomycetota bacterium]